MLRLEGAALLAGGLYAFGRGEISWWWFALLLLVPDLSMVGYLRNPGVGAAIYNLGHSVIGPVLLLTWYLAGGPRNVLAAGAIWLAHIGMDRMFGYGLKHGDDFQHTHLGWIGRGEEY